VTFDFGNKRSDDLSNGGLLADTSKQCPDKPSVKYVDFIFVKFSEKGIFYAFQPKFEKPPSKCFFFFKFLTKQSAFSVQ